MIRGGAVVLPTTDVERAVRFYVETLGMKLVREAPGSATIDAGEGFQLELRKSAAAGGSEIVFHPKVPIDEAIAIYENRGVDFTVERKDGTVRARFQDPDGHVLVLSG